jgi:hypothetical protein
MPVRTVSVVLIAAVLACPTRCTKGLCHHRPCCSEQQSSQLQTADCETDCCCCKKDSSGSNADQPGDPSERNNNPSTPPCESSCQGVCGGAIFEKRCVVDDGIDFGQLLADAPEPAVASGSSEFRTHLGEHFLHGGNHGRCLRTLHSSFLC